MKKRAIAGMIIASMTLSLAMAFPFSPANAEDVTSSMKKNSTVNYFAEQLNLYVDMEVAAKDISSGTKKFKMTDSKKVDIVCAALSGKDAKTAIDHDETIKDGDYSHVKDPAIKKLYKKLYNTSVDLSNITMTKKEVTVKKNDKFYYMDADWEDKEPSYTINSIYKDSSKILTVEFSNDFKNADTGIKYYTQGTTTMKLKKTSKGYMLKKVFYTVSQSDYSDNKDIAKYASVLKNLKDGQSYAFVDMSDSIDALLVTDDTYKYNSKTSAAIEATVYGLNSRGQAVVCGKVSSAGTSYPLACGNSNHCLYYGSGHSVTKVTLKNNSSLYTVESASEEYDSKGKVTYYYNGNIVSNDTNLQRLYSEWFKNSKVIDFTPI